MFRKNFITNSIRFGLIGSAAALTMNVPVALAAEEAVVEEVERIEITGSAIKRTDMEGALPIQLITQEDIARSGVTSAAELIQQLPAMQGFTTPSESVGGSGGGMATASLRDLGEQYTLVLLNGRRLAPSDSGGTVDLNSIPLSAIERVEVLTDGASALYGSDAIAGVVNFILKKEQQGTTVSARYDRPEESGGQGHNLSISTGFGDFDNDGYSFVLSYSHDRQAQLASTDRDFAKTGIISFQHEGRDLYFFNGSGNAIPGNARVTYTPDDPEFDDNGDPIKKKLAFNPYSQQNGTCAENTSAINQECWFDYTSTIEIVPESQRDTVYGNAQFAITDDITAFTNIALAKFSLTSRIAPYPTGWFNLPSDSDLVLNEVKPYIPTGDSGLSATEIDSISQYQGRWRALPAGNRTTEFDTTSIHVVGGLEGITGDIDWSGAFTYSVNDSDQNYPEGWLMREPFLEEVSSGNINVFVPDSELDQASRDALAKTVYSGNWTSTKVTLTGFDAKASMPVFELPEGDVYVATGFDIRNYNYENTIADANANEELLFLSKGTAYELERLVYGAFAEMQIPVIEDLDVTASLRYDYVGVVHDNLNDVKKNKADSDITYKLSSRYQATENLLLRASYGTGFKAPTMLSIARPRADFGVTGGTYDCPFPSGDPLKQYCLTGASQYGVFKQGNPDLESETSTQYSAGFVFAPSTNFSFQMDYWNIELDNMVTALTEKQLFDNAEQYRNLFTTRTNLSTGEEELAILQSSVNVGKSKNSGVDWLAAITNDLGFGTLRTTWGGTYMIESTYTKPGTDSDWVSSMGRFGDNNSVTFRVVQQLSSTLSHDDFAHTMRVNYRSGYQDQFQSKESGAVTLNDAYGDAVDVQLRVPSYTTVDYLSEYYVLDNLKFTFGVNNLFDKAPSLSLRSGGAGHQVGYDPRYTDSYGRTYYLQGDFSF